jgi:hypothetical protein
MQVKLFWKNNPLGPNRWMTPLEHNALAFEGEINDWLRANPGIKIVDIRQSAAGGIHAQPLWLISVWYEESASG